MNARFIYDYEPPLFDRLSVFLFDKIRLWYIVNCALIAILALSVATGYARPQSQIPDHSQAAAEQLTQSLVALNARLKQADPKERSKFLGDLLALAAERWVLLTSLIEDNPGAILQVALPTHLRTSLPAAVQSYIEEEVEIEGRLEILHEDWASESRYHYSLHRKGQRFALRFAADPPMHLLTGAQIRARGIRLDATLALAGGGNSVQTLSAAPAPNTFGEQRTLVMLVNFADNPAQPWSREAVNQAIFGTMNDFIIENSYDAAWVTGDVTDWLTIALSSSVCSTSTLASQAQQAAIAAGWALDNYSRWIYAFPRNMCGFGGASSIGGTPSQAWLNGEISLRIAGHEYGHGLGLWHSHSMDCGDVPLGPSCTTQEYGDTADLMGTAETAHFNPFQKERLGWLTPLTVTESGTYNLDAYEIDSSLLALKIFKSMDTTGAPTWYYLEARKRIGFDSNLPYPGISGGVIVRLGSESNGNTSYMLDMTPNSRSIDRLDPALVPDQSFSDPDAGVTITTESVTTDGATVTVHLDTPDISVTVNTAESSYTRNQDVSITTTVMSGGSPVPGASVTFTVTKASGAIVLGNATTGSNGTAVYTFRLKKQDPVGTYQVDVVAKKGTLSGSAVTQFTVR